MDLVKNQIAKGATDQELQFCLAVARRHKLDPFRGQIWFVPRNDGDLGVKRWIPIVGINGLLHIAARDHRDFGSISEPEYGPMHTVEWYNTKNGTKGKYQAPEWARVSGWKKGFAQPVVATVYWDEIYPNTGYSPLVRQMPRHMLGKVATAAVIRKGWPATDGLYIREEFQGGPEQFTPGGRRIVYPVIDQPEMADLDENAAHGHPAGSRQAEMAQKALEKAEAADRAYQKEKAKAAEKPSPAPAVPQAAPIKKLSGTVELDWMADGAWPVVRADFADFGIWIQNKMPSAQWGADSWWHIPVKDAPLFRKVCFEANVELKEIRAKTSPRGKEAVPQTTTPAPGSARHISTGAGAKSGTDSTPELATVVGVIQHFTEKMTKGRAGKESKPYLNVLLKTYNGDRWYSVFDRDLFPYLSKSKGKDGEFFVRKSGEFQNLVGIKRIGNQEFEEGKLPVTKLDREPGSLFK